MVASTPWWCDRMKSRTSSAVRVIDAQSTASRENEHMAGAAQPARSDLLVLDDRLGRNELDPRGTDRVQAHQVAGRVPEEATAPEIRLGPRAEHYRAIDKVVGWAFASLRQIQPTLAVDHRVRDDLDDDVTGGELLAGQRVEVWCTVHNSRVRVGDGIPGIGHVVPTTRRVADSDARGSGRLGRKGWVLEDEWTP